MGRAKSFPINQVNWASTMSDFAEQWEEQILLSMKAAKDPPRKMGRLPEGMNDQRQKVTKQIKKRDVDRDQLL